MTSCACASTVYVGNTNIIKLSGLQQIPGGAYVDDAAVEITVVKDGAGDPVVGQVWPTPMAYVTGSNGDYEGTLDADLALSSGRTYTAIVTATAPGLTVGAWTLEFVPRTRTL